MLIGGLFLSDVSINVTLLSTMPTVSMHFKLEQALFICRWYIVLQHASKTMSLAFMVTCAKKDLLSQKLINSFRLLN